MQTNEENLGKIVQISPADERTIEKAIKEGRDSVTINGVTIEIVEGKPEIEKVPDAFAEQAKEALYYDNPLINTGNTKLDKWSSKQIEKARKRRKKKAKMIKQQKRKNK